MIHSLSSVIFEFLRWFVQDSLSLIIILTHSFFPILPVVHEDLLKLRYVTSQSFSRRISSMHKSIGGHQFNFMKDKHTINLILISSKRVILSFGVCSWWINSSSKCFIFSFPEFKFPRHLVGNLHLNHHKAHLVLSSFILSHHPFVTGVLHGGSSWFNLFFKCSSRFLFKEF